MYPPHPLEDEHRLRDEAFDLLAAVVEENYAEGRRSYGASLKPELRRRTHDGFMEARLGFSSFGEFLHAAKRAGRIMLYDAPRGPDREATPPGKPPLAVADAAAGTTDRVRGDLWDAFINWDEGWVRFYDREADRADRYPSAPVPLEPPRLADLRAQVENGGDRYVFIDPITFDEQCGWMAEFAASEADATTRARLEEALRQDRPVRAFSQALSVLPEARARWRSRRVREVHRRIRAWADERDLDLEIFDHDAKVSANDTVGTVAQASTSDRLSELRRLLHRAVDRMPEAELLALRLPVEYLIEI